MTTLLIPGMVIKPASDSTTISCAHRILYVHEPSDRIVLIPVEPHRSSNRMYFVSYTNTSLTDIRMELDPKDPKLAIITVQSRADATATDEELDKKYLRKGQIKSTPRLERERRWALIQPLVANHDAALLFDHQIRHEQIALRAKQLSDSSNKIRRLRVEIRDCLNQYWAGGSTRGALTPYRGACGGRGKEKVQRNKLGKHNAPTRKGLKGLEGYVLAEYDKDIIRFSWRNYYIRGTTIDKAYRKMCREFYSVELTDEAGRLQTQLLPAHERPTKDQFRRWGAKQSPDQAAWKKQLSKTNAARIDRAIIGNANDDIAAVGQRASVDSSPPDMHFISTVRRLDRIGMAYRVLVVDSAFRYIPGFYLGLHAPSAETVKLAFLHAMTPKSNWLKFLGLDDQSADDWIPIAFTSAIADNTDARAEEVFVSLDVIGTGQFYIPVARSDLNSDAEVSHHQLHRMVDHNMLGTTHGRRTSERMEERSDDLARHTILEAIRETARAIHTHNTMPLDIHPTIEMQRELLDKDLPITRLNLTRMRINQGKVSRTLLDLDEARMHLMPITRGTFTAKGVKLLRPDTGNKRTFVEQVRFVSRHPLMIERFSQAKNERGKHRIDFYDEDFRHDPYNPTEIFYRNPVDGEFIRLEARSDDREMLQECSYHDILYNMDHYAIYRHEVVEGQDQARSRMESGQEETKWTAKDEYDAELGAEPNPPSKTKLRGNKSQNRERENALYQYGMPIQPPPASALSTAATDDPEPTPGTATPGNPADAVPSDNSATHQVPIQNEKTKSFSVFANAVRNRLNQETPHGNH